jgi:hypothetical protein
VSDIDWGKVDTDYTHYSKEYGYFVREIKHTNAWACKDGPVLVFLDPGRQLIARPSAWNGTGLPPAGTVCECHLPGELTNNYSWVTATVIWHNSKTECAVIRSSSHLAWCDEFRPIRTQEQIAADEREAAILEMSKCADGMYFPNRHTLGALYDAGYRKP